MMIYKNIISLFILFFLSDVIYAQKPNYDSLTEEKHKLIVSFLDLKETDKIADIGTNSGYSLIPIANEYPDIKFTVEDIDSSSCNIKTLTKRIKKLGNKTRIEQFSFVYGTETSTNLPTDNFSKVLMFMVVHEMTFKKEMLQDIKRILQKNGSLFIQENIAHKPQKKQRACNYRFLTEDEFKQLMTENKFLLKREQISFDTGHNTYLKLFEYTVAD
jgi:ubiquinone/menaquinone biosynthesis C-methylase UbiE